MSMTVDTESRMVFVSSRQCAELIKFASDLMDTEDARDIITLLLMSYVEFCKMSQQGIPVELIAQQAHQLITGMEYHQEH